MTWLPENALIALQCLYEEAGGEQKAVTVPSVRLRVERVKEERAHRGKLTRGSFNDLIQLLVKEGFVDRPEVGLIRPTQPLFDVYRNMAKYFIRHYLSGDLDTTAKVFDSLLGRTPKGSE